LGLVGTSVGSSAGAVATTDLTTAAGFVTITSVGAGTAMITVNDGTLDGTHTATIAVTVAADGSITIGAITPYVAPAAPTFVSAATSDATHIVITMSSALTGTAGAPAAFTVASVASNPAVTGVAVSGTSVTLTLDHSIVGTDTPTVAYTHTGTTDLTNGTLVADFTAHAVTNNVALAIGDSYGGGKVAYILQDNGAAADDPGYDANVQHGLIAATVDQSTGPGIVWWNGSYIPTGATGTALGTGNANTNTIVANQGAGSYAAQLCADLVLGGYSDWYLPSKDELNKLYLNQGTIGNFAANAYYWSSSEYNNINALNQAFDFFYQGINDKANLYHVRAIRAF